jgi:DNA-binding transcriptional MerR regulator
MASYSIGEVEQLTGIKPYVLRYWEEVIPCFAPKKDMGGRRIYTQREIDIIRRLKFLIYEKRYTIDGARIQIIQETAAMDSNATALQALHEIREELGNIYLMVKKSTDKRQSSSSVSTPSQEQIE